MALTVNQAFLSAVGYIKAASTYANVAEELRMANTVNDIIANFHNWSWSLTAGTDVSVTSSNQDYSLASADQNVVNAISTANLLSGSTNLPELAVGTTILPKGETATGKRPFAVCMLSETQIRLHPFPDASYTFQFNYHIRATEFTANSENWDIPSAWADVAKAGMIWQVLDYSTDSRAQPKQQEFLALLANKKEADMRRIGRRV